jgi:hypothetical protein
VPNPGPSTWPFLGTAPPAIYARPSTPQLDCALTSTDGTAHKRIDWRCAPVVIGFISSIDLFLVSHPDSGDNCSVPSTPRTAPRTANLPVTYDGLDFSGCLGARHLIFGSVMLLIRYTAAFPPSPSLRSHVTTIQDRSMHLLQTAQGSSLTYWLSTSSLIKISLYRFTANSPSWTLLFLRRTMSPNQRVYASDMPPDRGTPPINTYFRLTVSIWNGRNCNFDS